MKDPTLVAKKWATNLAGSTESIKAGVQAVKTSPTQLAAQNADRMAAGVAQAVSSGRYQAGCNKVSLQSWQDSMINKGLQRLPLGAQQGQAKQVAFQQRWLPVMDQAAADARQFPRDGGQGSLQRVKAIMDAGRRFAGK